MSSDLPVIYRAADLGEADIVVSWLRDKGIPAEIKDSFAAGNLQSPAIVAPVGIEIVSLDPDKLAQARELLANHFQKEKETKPQANRPSLVKAECEECGTISSFPGELSGKVDLCPACNAYIDIPD